MTKRYDVIVIGLGGMGSAALCHLAARGKRVLGIERFTVPHQLGSSHGYTRIIRLAYYEHSDYVPLLKRAYELWRELERQAGEQLLHITGSVDAGPPGSLVFEGSLASCLDHGLTHETLTSAELSRRFPGYQLPTTTMALFQPEGGFLTPERCIIAHVQQAVARGAATLPETKVLGWEPIADGVRVDTERGRFEADKLVIAAGAWAGHLAPEVADLAMPERQALSWFQPLRPEWFQPSTFPVFNVWVDEGRFYGFPEFFVPGFKVGKYHHLEERVNPDTIDRGVYPRDEGVLREFTAKYFPAAAGQTALSMVCMFTNSPDEHFLIDHHPKCANVALAAGFSGHGFKFCSVVGEILADLTIDGSTRHAIDLFRLNRFGKTW